MCLEHCLNLRFVMTIKMAAVMPLSEGQIIFHNSSSRVSSEQRVCGCVAEDHKAGVPTGTRAPLSPSTPQAESPGRRTSFLCGLTRQNLEESRASFEQEKKL